MSKFKSKFCAIHLKRLLWPLRKKTLFHSLLTQFPFCLVNGVFVCFVLFFLEFFFESCIIDLKLMPESLYLHTNWLTHTLGDAPDIFFSTGIRGTVNTFMSYTFTFSNDQNTCQRINIINKFYICTCFRISKLHIFLWNFRNQEENTNDDILMAV